MKTARVICTFNCTRNCAYCSNKYKLVDDAEILSGTAQLEDFEAVCLSW